MTMMMMTDMNTEQQLANTHDQEAHDQEEAKELELEERLKQMRVRRFQAQAAREAAALRDDDDSAHSSVAYSIHRLDSAGKLPESPTSVFGVGKELLEREVIAKLQGFASGSSSALPLNSSSSIRIGTGSVRGRDEPRTSSVDFGKYKAQAKQLEYTSEDLHQLIEDGGDFHRLQRSLRNKGAVTNELLKQVLPFVIQQCQERRQRHAERARGKEAAAGCVAGH